MNNVKWDKENKTVLIQVSPDVMDNTETIWEFYRYSAGSFKHDFIYAKPQDQGRAFRIEIFTDEGGTASGNAFFTDKVFPSMKSINEPPSSYKEQNKIIKDRLIKTTPEMICYCTMCIFRKYMIEAGGEYSVFQNNCKKFCEEFAYQISHINEDQNVWSSGKVVLKKWTDNIANAYHIQWG